MFYNLPRKFKTGVKKINQKNTESHSTTGLTRIKKSKRLFLFWPILSKEHRTILTDLTGYGRKFKLKNSRNSMTQFHNLRISSINLMNSQISITKFLLSQELNKLVFFLSKQVTSKKAWNSRSDLGKMLTPTISILVLIKGSIH